MLSAETLSQEECLTPEERALRQKKESLLLERTRVMRELEAARSERHKDLLKLALEHLNARLAELEPPA